MHEVGSTNYHFIWDTKVYRPTLAFRSTIINNYFCLLSPFVRFVGYSYDCVQVCLVFYFKLQYSACYFDPISVSLHNFIDNHTTHPEFYPIFRINFCRVYLSCLWNYRLTKYTLPSTNRIFIALYFMVPRKTKNLTLLFFTEITFNRAELTRGRYIFIRRKNICLFERRNIILNVLFEKH